MEFQITMDYTVEDFEAYWRAFVWKKPETPAKKRASPRMHRNVGLFFLAMGTVTCIWAVPLAGVLELVLGGMLVYSGWYLGRPGAASRWAKKAWEKYRAGGQVSQCHFTEDGVRVHDGKNEHCCDYDSLKKVWEDEGHYYLVLPQSRMYLLPKRMFTQGAPEDFPAFWRERTGKDVERVK